MPTPESRRRCRYPTGQCPRGDECMFYHDQQTSKNVRADPITLPSPRKATAAKSTTSEPQRPTASQRKPESPVCKYYATGSCIYGDSCRNRHTVSEEREILVCQFFMSGYCK